MPENNGTADHPMSEIAERFKDATESYPRRQDAAIRQSTGAHPSDGAVPADQPSPTTDALDLQPLSVQGNQIEPPAFFVDRDLTIRWIAAGDDDRFCQALAREKASSSDGNIFSLLLKPTVKDTLPEWQALFSFVYISLRRSTSPDTFETQTDFIAQEHRPGHDPRTDRPAKSHRFDVDSRRLETFTAAGSSARRLFRLGFAQGTLFLLRQDSWSQPFGDADSREHPSDPATAYDHKETVCILSVRLNESHRIADAMLADVYFKMMNRVWKETDDVAASLGGMRAGGNGAHMQYLFKATAGRNPIFSAIWCATRLNRRMQALQAKLKAELGWADELCMNMGISHGESDAALADMDNCMAFTIPGGALDQSAMLSTIASKGDVWITKSAVSQLPKALMDQVVLGVERQGEFVRNFFARIADLSVNHPSDPMRMEMAMLSVTRIIGIEKASAPPQ